MKIFYAFLLLALMVSSSAIGQTPYAEWTFDDADNLTAASVGEIDLLLEGGTDAVAIDGPTATDGAVQIDVGTHYKFVHGLTPADGETLINKYSMVFDFRIAELGNYKTFYQSDATNDTDGELFIHKTDGDIGTAASGYSDPDPTGEVGAWHRLVLVVNNGVEFSLYLDGVSVLVGNVQDIDSRFSLASEILFFGDNDGDDGLIDIAKVSFYDVPLDALQVSDLGSVALNIEKAMSPEFGLYPNPTADILYVNAENEVNNVSVFSVTGQQMRNIPVDNQTEFSLDVQNLKSGLYFLQIETEKGTISRKFQKQ